MGLKSFLQSCRPSGSQLLISLLIAGLGWLSAQALSLVDQDLRIMYAEYTLGAIDLAHISGDIMRYQSTLISALEAESQKDFEQLTESLPARRAKIQHAVDRYAAAGLRVSRSGRSEPEDIEAVRHSLDQYFSVASTTVQLLTQEWTAVSLTAREAIRRKAEVHAADNAGPKMIQVSLALDQLEDTVAEVAKDMRDEGTKTIRLTSLLLVAGSLFIAFLNLLIARPRRGRSRQDGSPSERESNPPHNPVPLPLDNAPPHSALRQE